ncbi:16S rRNA (guanine(966)-N(2))-methyltransferase RsmD [Alteromonas gracilis]
MTRIIGGTAKGRRLRAPSGEATRPTTDRVREALFSVLVSEFGDLGGLRVLDLYSGSGAVGLEAVSRGAVATLVERDRRAAALIRDNARAVGLDAEVVTASVPTFLGGEPRPFDLVFADPPYDLSEEALGEVLTRLAAGWTTAEGLVVVERSARSPEPVLPEGLTLLRTRRYGETALHVVAADSTPPSSTAHDGEVSPC